MAITSMVLAALALQVRTTNAPEQLSQSDLIIHAPRYIKDVGSAVTTFPEGAEVQYGVTTVLADYVLIDEAGKHGVARGNVRLIDHDGILHAESIEFFWGANKTRGSAIDFTSTIDSLTFAGKSATYSMGTLDVRGMSLGPADRTKGLYKVEARRFSLVTGKYMRLEEPRLSLLGVKLPGPPFVRANLDPRVRGVGLPSVSISNGGPGVTYSPNFLIGPQAAMQTWFNVYRKTLPRYGVEVAKSFLPESEPDQGRITPISDLDTRFGYGYFDNVIVGTPLDEFEFERQHRKSIAIDSEANQGSNDRLFGGSITKALEIVYEEGGPLGPLGEISHVRLQSVREQGQAGFTQRAVIDTSVAPRPIPILRGIDALLRFDTSGYMGAQTFGWIRGQAGISVRPVSQLTLSAAYNDAKEFGTPDMLVDRLYTDGGYALRGDLHFGPFLASYLQRYTLSGQFYDDEYQLSDAVGILRLSLLYRRFPSDFRLRVQFRLDDFINTVKRHHGQPQIKEEPVPLFR